MYYSSVMYSVKEIRTGDQRAIDPHPCENVKHLHQCRVILVKKLFGVHLVSLANVILLRNRI